MIHRPRRLAITLAVVAAVTAAMSACSSSGGSGKTDDSSSAASNASSSRPAGVSEATALLSAHASGVGGKVPTAAQEPKTIPTGKNVWVISCGQALAPCADATNAAVTAGKVLGWHVHTFDGKLNPTSWNSGIRQAIAAHADAIVTQAIDCPAVSQSLAAAKAKGIITESTFSYDCNDPAFGQDGKVGPQLYTHIAQTGPTGTMDDTGKLIGRLQAAWAIKDSDGKAKVIQFDENDQTIVAYVERGFEEQMKTCSGCKIVAKVPFSITDIGPSLVQKARTALLKNPDADYAMAPNDTSALFVNQAITQAGKKGKVKVLGSLGNPANLQNIMSGGPQVMSVATDTAWIGWAGMDDLVHLFAKSTPVYSGWDAGVLDKSNIKSTAQYVAPSDYATLYPKAWGKS